MYVSPRPCTDSDSAGNWASMMISNQILDLVKGIRSGSHFINETNIALNYCILCTTSILTRASPEQQEHNTMPAWSPQSLPAALFWRIPVCLQLPSIPYCAVQSNIIYYDACVAAALPWPFTPMKQNVTQQIGHQLDAINSYHTFIFYRTINTWRFFHVDRGYSTLSSCSRVCNFGNSSREQ